MADATPAGTPYEVILDREAAVRRATELAYEGEGPAIVCLLAKGDETRQHEGNDFVPLPPRRRHLPGRRPRARRQGQVRAVNGTAGSIYTDKMAHQRREARVSPLFCRRTLRLRFVAANPHPRRQQPLCYPDTPIASQVRRQRQQQGAPTRSPKKMLLSAYFARGHFRGKASGGACQER